MSAENPRYGAYFTLVHRAEELSFWSSADGIIVSGLVGFSQVVLDAQQAGLTPHEIRTAVAIGEYRGQPEQVLYPEEPQPESYWEAVREEAEQFWLRRYRGEE